MHKLIFLNLLIVNGLGHVFAQPKIDSITPKKNYAFMNLKIHGSGFINVQKVTFGGIHASSFYSISPNLIEAVPSFFGASGFVAVHTLNGVDSLGGFVLTPFPTFSSMSPISGGVGTEINIVGTNMPQDGKILLGGQETEILFRSDTLVKIKLIKPASGFISFKLNEISSIGTDLFFNYSGLLDLKACPGNPFVIQVGPNGSSNYQWQVSKDSGQTFADIYNGELYAGVNITQLYIKSIDSSMYNHIYRCSTDNNEYINGGIIKFYHFWNIYSTDLSWENPANWSCGSVPNYTTDVEIPPGAQVTVSSNVTCKSISLEEGAIITVNPGFLVSILK